MASTLTTCPVCKGHLRAVRLECISCGTAIEGSFETSRLGQLSKDQQHFVEVFLESRGNIKEVEKRLGISYPTVRKQLDLLLHALGLKAAKPPIDVSEVLDAISKGEMTVDEAVEKLR